MSSHDSHSDDQDSSEAASSAAQSDYEQEEKGNHGKQPSQSSKAAGAPKKSGKELKSAQNAAKEQLNQQKIVDTLGRYKYLLGQTDLFAHFIKAKGLLDDEAMQDLLSTDKKADKTPGTGKRRAGGKKPEKGGRVRKTEKEEDEELLQDELEENEHEDQVLSTETVFHQSPKYVTGGTMRDYQVHGLNWMISLFEHGINGILADEMGLVCASFILWIWFHSMLFRGKHCKPFPF